MVIWRNYLVSRRDWLQRVFVSGLAASTAFGLGSLISLNDGEVAAILAVITLRISIQASLYEAFSQFLGTLMGVAVAFLGIKLIGSSIVLILLLVMASFFFAKVMGLGDDGGINIAITAIIVSAPGQHTSSALTRLGGTLIGVLTALLFSYWAHPTSPLKRTAILCDNLTSELKREFKYLSLAVSEGSSPEKYGEILARARKLSDSTLKIREQGEEAIRYARWSPLASTSDAGLVFNRYVALEHMTVQLRNLARTLFDYELGKHSISPIIQNLLSENFLRVSNTFKLKEKKARLTTIPRLHEKELAPLQDSIELLLALIDQISNKKEIIMVAGITQSLERIEESFKIDIPAVSMIETPELSKNPVKNFIDNFKVKYGSTEE